MKNNKWTQEKELQRILALEYVKEYCIKNGLSIEKLKKQRFELPYDECVFFKNEGNLIIEETEFTEPCHGRGAELRI